MKTDRDFKTFKEWRKEDGKANLIPVPKKVFTSRLVNVNWD